MKTLNLQEAADFLKMTPEGLRRLAAAGNIPAAKPGKRWCFLEDDLANYLRSLYSSPAKASWGVHLEEIKKWHSTKEMMSGGFPSAITENAYKKALGLPIK